MGCGMCWGGDNDLGLRVGEIYKLNLEDIDLKKKTTHRAWQR